MITADLKGRRALVTGAASGIGLATATRFAKAGARVALNHLPEDPAGPEQAERLRAEGLDVVAVAGNVSVAGEAEAMVRDAIERLGGLDYLVNNAGTSGTREPIAPADMDKMTEEFWSLILSTNLIGPFRCTHAAAEALRASKGAVANVASIAGLGQPGSSLAYGASKAGLISLTKSLARALAPEARVNAVAPGHVATPWTSTWPEERRKASAERALLKRHCTADDIAEALFFLCAGGAMITGHTLVVDGGITV
ncbi:SDR family NAD(P)-dependent oxidoreductase [Marinimicrococcus flavescens]|uniref:SDR family oxidoreductase n=1 Tax=Marinimicrococcus flavescens TaxID=3031815 RepID=A0AAP3XPZ8_9PROT|nr:SDR family oxidoreductase [Marinimicrococcus flavescens]